MANFSKYQTLDLHLEQSVAEKWKILLHSQDSLNDALYIHPNFQITSSRYKSKQFMIRSKRMSKTSTGPRPCQKYWPKACHEMYLHKKIRNEYNCTIPILDSGIHFQQGNLSIGIINVWVLLDLWYKEWAWSFFWSIGNFKKLQYKNFVFI